MQFNLNADIEPIRGGNNDSELHNKLYQLEKEMRMKNIEIKDLTDKVGMVYLKEQSFSILIFS